MKALNLIRSASYGPERLKQIYQAFDQAWEAIKPLVDDHPLAHEAARLELANAILSVAKDGLGDPAKDGLADSPAGLSPSHCASTLVAKADG
jgi:hypothetical protein